MFAGAAVAVFEAQAADFALAAGDFGGLRMGADGDVGQAFEFADQHGVGFQVGVVFEHGDVPHHAGQVNGRFHAGIAAADDGHVLALEQRAVAVRAIGDAFGFVFLLAGHVHVAPARAGGHDERAALQRAAVFQPHGDQAAGLGGGDDFGHALGADEVYLVIAHVLLQLRGPGGAVGFGHAGVVGDFHRVVHLAAKAFGHQAGADAFARGVNGRRGASGAAANHQHVKRRFGRELSSVARGGARVHFLQDFFQRHAAAGEELAVQIDGGHAHDFARFDFLGKQRAVNHRHANARVEDGHERERLHHVGAVVARQAHVNLEIQVLRRLQRLDLRQCVFGHFGRVPARPQQRQHQAGEFVAQRNGGKVQMLRAVGPREGERRRARVAAIGAQRDVRAHARHLLQQLAQFGGFGVAAQRGREGEGAAQHAHVLLQLGGDVFVKHEDSFRIRWD